MKVGINLLLWSDDIDDGFAPTLETLKQIGYDGVEMPLYDLDESKWRRWAVRLGEIGLEPTAGAVMSPEDDPVSEDPAVQARAWDHMRRAIDCCAALGARVFCGPHQAGIGVFPGRGPTEAEWARSAAHLRRVSEYAAPAGVTLAVEVVNRFELYLGNTVDEVVGLVDRVGMANCGIHYDTFHSHIEERDPAAAIRRAGSRLAYVHVSENDRGTPGTGSIRWDATFGALRDIGYDGWLVVEAFGTALPHLAAATKTWRPLFESEEQAARGGHDFIRRQLALH